jgi:DNA-directed RNA polymerase beta subunit
LISSSGFTKLDADGIISPGKAIDDEEVLIGKTISSMDDNADIDPN